MKHNVLAPAALAVLAACAAAPGAASAPARTAQAPAAARLSLHDCAALNGALRARCGTLRVHEDRERRAGREIELSLVVVPAESPVPAPDPVFVLAGGPGQVATELVEIARLLTPLRRDRDFVFVDQRGTGASNPLVCAETGEPAGGYGAEYDAHWAACRSALEARADLRHYATATAVDDFDEVRAALGYERVNLIGGSYGTRIAQIYLRQHPERVRSAVLWAVAPLASYSIPFDGALAVQGALERLLADCDGDAACSVAFPRLGVQLDSLLAALAAEPVHATVGSSDAGATTVEIDDALFAQTLLALLYNAGHMRKLPLLVDRAARGDWTLFGSIASQVSAAKQSEPDGLYLSVLCSEDVPRIPHGRLDEFRGPLGALLRASVEELQHRCARWPRAGLPGDHHQPVRSPAPVLLLSGAADPATPPGGGEQVLRHLANARHLMVPASSHGPIFPGCVRDLVARFIAEPRPAELDSGCVREIEWAPFAVPSIEWAPFAVPSGKGE